MLYVYKDDFFKNKRASLKGRGEVTIVGIGKRGGGGGNLSVTKYDV